MRQIGFTILLAVAVFTPMSASASPGGITISPPLQQVVLRASGETPLTFAATNNTQAPQTYALRVVDFKSLSESGGLAFIGKDLHDEKYGLSKWLHLTQDQIVVAAGETRNVTATISADASPGGHYSAILLSSKGPIANTVSDRVDLEQVASGLIFAIKSGGARYNLHFDSFVNLPNRTLQPPKKIRLRYFNAGNVHVVPRGLVRITDPTGKVVGQGAINTETGIILPESYRQFAVPINRLANSWIPGIYHVKASYRYEGTDIEQVATSKIMIVSWYFILISATALMAIIGFGAWYIHRGKIL